MVYKYFWESTILKYSLFIGRAYPRYYMVALIYFYPSYRLHGLTEKKESTHELVTPVDLLLAEQQQKKSY